MIGSVAMNGPGSDSGQSGDANRQSLLRDPVLLASAVVGAMILTAVVLAGCLTLAHSPAWWSGFFAATVVSALAAVLSLGPLLVGLRLGASGAVAAYFLSAGIRAAVSLGACLLAVRVGGYPAAPTLLLMVPYYFAVLAVESAFMGRAIWNKT